ncbi:hypothetical protein MS5N3_28720 [Marinobacter salsuginis]|jgi:hypothetical protein|uniref:Uncharacterized protein n=1 Tax=Marinobacter salsuginis TaxID=418719 RepID=A0A5M3PRK9_9GAMM|nr:hypothetical protein MS5N3_28720 [Marinobacter salsuginis]
MVLMHGHWEVGAKRPNVPWKTKIGVINQSQALKAAYSDPILGIKSPIANIDNKRM